MSNQNILLIFIVAYCLFLFFVAFITSRNANSQSFFIGNKNSHWALVAFGMIGTSLSGMTFISVPGTVGKAGFAYFQVVMGYFIGYFIISNVLLPLYYKLNLTSIYTYLKNRFNPSAYKFGALIFIVSRTMGATLRLYLVIKVLQLFVLDNLNISFEITTFLVILLIVLYTFKGGVKTIVWTDTLQTSFMLLALIICIGYILNHLGLNIPEAISQMSTKQYTKVLNFDILHKDYFLKSIIGGALITITMTGLDQEMMQKNISVSSLKDAQKNMKTFSFILLFVNLLFLFLGGLLYLYAENTGISEVGDNLFPTFALQSGVPFYISVIFIIGLISALFPSADGALTALTSSFCIDILGIEIKSNTTKTIRIVHLSFAVLFILIIFILREKDNGSLIGTLLTLASYTYGPLLGLFAFGILTKKQIAKFSIPLAVFIPPIVCYYLNSLQMSYKFGYEILFINGFVTFLILTLFSKNKQND